MAALVSGLGAAANTVVTKKLPYSATQSTLLLWTSGIVANVPLMFLLHEHFPAVGWHMAWAYLLLYVAASLVASWTFVKGLKLIEAGVAGILGLLEIVFGAVFGILFFHERLSFVVLIGMATIMLAASIPYLKDYNAARGTLDETSG
jgi:drug/metabolite transporter (DMT)-like permease